MGCGSSTAPTSQKYATDVLEKKSPTDNKRLPINLVVEHYQPYEFPMRPIVNERSQQIIQQSWQEIINNTYDCDQTQSGTMSGASYFFNTFFDQLFVRFKDFKTLFPSIQQRATIISKVMALLVKGDDLESFKKRIRAVAVLHVKIVGDPWLFGIFSTNILNTVRLCLGEKATDEVMTAWLHLLSFVLRTMLPEYFNKLGHFSRYSDGIISENGVVNVNTTASKPAEKKKPAASIAATINTPTRGFESKSPRPPASSIISARNLGVTSTPPSSRGRNVQNENSRVGSTQKTNEDEEKVDSNSEKKKITPDNSGWSPASAMKKVTNSPGSNMRKVTIADKQTDSPGGRNLIGSGRSLAVSDGIRKSPHNGMRKITTVDDNGKKVGMTDNVLSSPAPQPQPIGRHQIAPTPTPAPEALDLVSA